MTNPTFTLALQIKGVNLDSCDLPTSYIDTLADLDGDDSIEYFVDICEPHLEALLDAIKLELEARHAKKED